MQVDMVAKILAEDLSALREEFHRGRTYEPGVSNKQSGERIKSTERTREVKSKTTPMSGHPGGKDKPTSRKQPAPDLHKGGSTSAATILESWTTVLGRKARKGAKTQQPALNSTNPS